MSEKPGLPTIMAEWSISEARVVGTLKRGGAIVEVCPTLNIREGRSWTSRYADEDDPDRIDNLEYDFTFEAGDEPPESMMSEWAAIVITGTDAQANKLSIEGKGWLGYDEYGRPQGSFHKPPKITILHGDDRPTSLRKAVAQQWKESPLNPARGAVVQ